MKTESVVVKPHKTLPEDYRVSKVGVRSAEGWQGTGDEAGRHEERVIKSKKCNGDQVAAYRRIEPPWV